MQENRSFDSYFGTFPGADGIPPGVCVPDPMTGGCVAPFHDPSDVNYGGPHGAPASTADIDGGNMDGFVGAGRAGVGLRRAQRSRLQPLHPAGDAPGTAERVRRRDGLPRRPRDPELLDLRAATSCSRTTCSSRTRPGACRSTCSWSPNGRRSARTRWTRSRAGVRSRTPTPMAATAAQATASCTTPGPT